MKPFYTIKYSFKSQVETIKNISVEDISNLYAMIYRGKKEGVDFVIVSDSKSTSKECMIISRKSINYIKVNEMNSFD